MKKFLSQVSMLFGLVAMAASTAQAQTTQNGPYYATPSWDQTLPAATRFVVLSNLNSDAILDRETGLVWTRFIISNSPQPPFPWGDAVRLCRFTAIGGRLGWRLPTMEEYMSLLDEGRRFPTVFIDSFPSPDFVPFFWSATSDELDSSSAWGFVREEPSKQFTPFSSAKAGGNANALWCVRGGTAHSSPNN